MDTCPMCGGDLPESRGNRPRRFCSDECKNAYSYLTTAENAIDKIPSMTPAAKKELRSRLWRMGNAVDVKK
jgi:hypothetical protein